MSSPNPTYRCHPTYPHLCQEIIRKTLVFLGSYKDWGGWWGSLDKGVAI
jgi:hypothetical protein